MVFEKKNYSINFLVDPLSLLGRFYSPITIIYIKVLK